jgi:hypothetical protein
LLLSGLSFFFAASQACHSSIARELLAKTGQWLITRNKYFDVVCGHERHKKPPKATNWSGIKNGMPSKDIRLSCYPSIDKKHI